MITETTMLNLCLFDKKLDERINFSSDQIASLGNFSVQIRSLGTFTRKKLSLPVFPFYSTKMKKKKTCLS